MMHKIIVKYIQEVLLNDEFDDEIDIQDDLLGGGILDSLGMMKLVLFIESEFQVQVPPEDMTIENFMTVGHINSYLEHKK